MDMADFQYRRGAGSDVDHLEFSHKAGPKFLGLFYGIILPMTACWKVHLVFQGKAADAVMIFLVAVLILGT